LLNSELHGPVLDGLPPQQSDEAANAGLAVVFAIFGILVAALEFVISLLTPVAGWYTGLMILALTSSLVGGIALMFASISLTGRSVENSAVIGAFGVFFGLGSVAAGIYDAYLLYTDDS
jgi:hypothetical protein